MTQLKKYKIESGERRRERGGGVNVSAKYPVSKM
jgi:hypothetical protein